MSGRDMLLSMLRRRAAAVPASAAEEPCAGCGEETAVGSVFFSDRRQTGSGPRVFLCSECQGKAHRERKGLPLGDADLRIIAGNGMMIGAGFLSGGR